MYNYYEEIPMKGFFGFIIIVALAIFIFSQCEENHPGSTDRLIESVADKDVDAVIDNVVDNTFEGTADALDVMAETSEGIIDNLEEKTEKKEGYKPPTEDEVVINTDAVNKWANQMSEKERQEIRDVINEVDSDTVEPREKVKAFLKKGVHSMNETARDISEGIENAVDEHTISKEEYQEMNLQMEDFKRYFIQNGYEVLSDIRIDGYSGYQFMKGDVSFVMLFPHIGWGTSKIFLSAVSIGSEDHGLRIFSPNGRVFNFKYTNSGNGIYNQIIKEDISLRSLPYEVGRMKSFQHKKDDVQEILDIFQYCEKNY